LLHTCRCLQTGSRWCLGALPWCYCSACSVPQEVPCCFWAVCLLGNWCLLIPTVWCYLCGLPLHTWRLHHPAASPDTALGCLVEAAGPYHLPSACAGCCSRVCYCWILRSGSVRRYWFCPFGLGLRFTRYVVACLPSAGSGCRLPAVSCPATPFTGWFTSAVHSVALLVLPAGVHAVHCYLLTCPM